MAPETSYINRVKVITSKKARALFLYLLHHPNLEHRNEKIIELLWRDGVGTQGQASLRQAVKIIRDSMLDWADAKLLARQGLLLMRTSNPKSMLHQIDATLKTTALAEAELAQIHAYFGLFDSVLGISDSLDSWISIEQANAQRLLIATLESRFGTADGHLAAELALELERGNERAARALILHLVNTNAPQRAIQVYNALYEHLANDYDQEPEPDTIALIAKVKMGDLTALDTKASAAKATRPLLAVVAINSADLALQDTQTLAVLENDIRIRLTRFREWRVAVQLSNEPADFDVRLRLLNDANHSLLTYEIVSAEKNEVVWSDTIAEPQKDWDIKARDLIASLATAVNVGSRRLRANPSEQSIYDRWVRSQVLLNLWSPATEEIATGLLSDITREAPNFGPAHAELAGALNVRHVLLPGTFQTEEVKMRAVHHAIEAIALDPLDSRAHRVLGWCLCHKGDFNVAEFHFEQALNLNRTHLFTVISCAMGFAFCGAIDRSRALVAEAERNDAALEVFHRVYLAASNYLAGNYETAVRQCERASNAMSTVGGWHTAALAALGQSEQARKQAQIFRRAVAADWVSGTPPLDSAIIDWFAQCFPLRDARVAARLRDDLETAMQTGPQD